MKAAETLSRMDGKDALTNYLKAVIAVRTGNNNTALEKLREALAQDSSLAKYAANDLEFKKLANDATFRIITGQ